MARTNDMFLARAGADTEQPEIWAVRSGETVIPIAGGDGSAERERKENEAARVAAEAARVTAEAARATAEQSREKGMEALESRQDANDAAQERNGDAQRKNDADQALNNEAMRKLSPVILQTGQYDPETLAPTIEGEPNRMYFVPITAASVRAVASLPEAVAAAVESGNAYAEWMWVGGKWEQMGTSEMEMRAIQTSDVDSVAAGGSPTGEAVLNLTGLSYLWSKLRGAFAALSHTHDAADVASGTLPVARGGTGAATASAALASLGAASATDLQSVRTQGYAPTRTVTDMLEVDVADMAGDANAPAKVVAANGSSLRNLPPGVAASGSVIGARRVFGLGGHVVVELTLGHPARGTWLNFYNGGSKRWEGWVRLATSDDLSAALPPERRTVAYTTVYTATAATSDPVVSDEATLRRLALGMTGSESGQVCASVTNGDWDARPVRVEGTFVQNGDLMCHLSSPLQAGQAVRLNVLVGFGKG